MVEVAQCGFELPACGWQRDEGTSVRIIISWIRLDHCEWQLLVGSAGRVRRSKHCLRRCTVNPLQLFLGPCSCEVQEADAKETSALVSLLR